MDTWEKSREIFIPNRVASNSSIQSISTKGSECVEMSQDKRKKTLTVQGQHTTEKYKQ